MRLDTRLFRRAALAAALLPATAIASEFVVALASEYGAFRDPTGKLAAAVAWLETVVESAPFPWVAAFTFGVAAGLWAEAFGRRTVSEARHWMTPYAARAKLIDPKFENAILTATGAYEPLRARSDEAQIESSRHGPNPDLFDAAIEAAECARRSHAQVEVAQTEAVSELVERLKTGELVAKGVAIEGAKAQDERIVPAAYWRFLNLDVTVAEARGAGRQFIGLMIAAARGAA